MKKIFKYTITFIVFCVSGLVLFDKLILPLIVDKNANLYLPDYRGYNYVIVEKKLDEQGVIDLIYKEGFSTADEVDEHAGRGQGMNLVKNLIEGMSGTFETSFETGKYFQLIIKLPVSGSMKEEPELDETANS